MNEMTFLNVSFLLAVLSWEALNPGIPVDEKYLEAFGFDISTLRDIYGEVTATYKDFIDVALGKTRFKTVEEKNRDAVIAHLKEKKHLNDEQVEFIMMFYDFKKRNPALTFTQFSNSQLLQQKGGIARIKGLFGSLDKFVQLYDEIKAVSFLDV